ncbi:hypothetical protein [Streptomyces sp. HNM0574]|uniref:hypothetical protein n=1 Tax=Streptomyces sp. HNM0574 TaxID=2714954 RepID=UPI00146BABD1|nr:hypothetical protein [Streptomyces sp. HNM0574]NLU67387.1 hypothetical protein [Streptomyces sp. HNM0574]
MPRMEPGAAARLLAQRPYATACFALGWLLMPAAALWGNAPAFAAALVLGYLSDRSLSRDGGRLDKALREVRFPATVRFLLRQVLLVLLLVRAGASAGLLTVALVALLAYYLLQVPQSVLLHRVRGSRKLPLAARNIDLTGLGLRDTPSRTWTSRAFSKSMHTDVLAMAGLLAAVTVGLDWPGYLGCGLTVALCLGYALVLGVVWLRARGMPDKERVLDHADAWLRSYRPTVMLYFSGTRGSAYQANMWLRTLAAAGGRPLVLLRERHILENLDPTPLPVLCVPSATDVMNRDFSSVRLVLYPANVGPNIHVLRMPQARHVFIGHGDSDKVASINPYAKVYDQVWTAGRAGRDRWAAAGVGVRDSAVVEVGRPQLAEVRRGPRPADGSPLTVLYAPTWEGWTDEPGNTSLIVSGAAVVELLLSLPTPVRVLYKPHPYTGIRAPEAREAHGAIVAALERANARAEADRAGADGGEEALRVAAAREELERVEAELASLGSRPRPEADDAERSRDAHFTAADAARAEELARAREALLWRGTEPWRHQHITAEGPHLYSCFNACDLLVSDVSSVVSDFMAGGKPYAITDVAELGADEFRRRNPSAGAAYLLSPDARELGDIVTHAAAHAGSGDDPMAEERARLRHYLLGPETPDATTRFNAAVAALLPPEAEHGPDSATEPVTDADDGEDPDGPEARGSAAHGPPGPEEPTSVPAG